MMSTRAAAFAGKISNLKEGILRIQNNTLPQPTCNDFANILKYFSQVLQDFKDFKDIENIPLYASEKKDQSQLIKTLPNFDYCGLYRTLSQLVDALPLIPQTAFGLDLLGANLLMLFKCLVPFLDQDNMETMPCLVATLLMSLPQSLHKDILDTLCFNLLPFTIDQEQNRTAKLLDRARGRAKGKEQTNGLTRGTQNKNIEAKKDSAHCIVRIEDHELSPPPCIGSPNDQKESDNQGSEAKVPFIIGECAKFDKATRGKEPGGSPTGQFNTIPRMDESELEDEDEYGLLSVTSILLIAFHYISEPMYHSQLIECLMRLKGNVFEDLLFVIAYGTTRAKCPAVEILFRYWPDICPNQQDRKNNNASGKLKHIKWQATKCQNKDCNFSSLGDNEAVKMCLDYKMSITMSELPPPMLICLDCVDTIYKDHLSVTHRSAFITDVRGSEKSAMMIQSMDDYGNKLIDILLPMDRISKLCENKKCKSLDKKAVGTCFDIECANYNSKKPIRYCRECFVKVHSPSEANGYDITIQTHIRHSSINLSIMENEENINNFVEAIISLLKEAAPADRSSKDGERYLRSLSSPISQFNTDNKDPNNATEEKQLNSQYGIWLMTGLCEKVDNIKDELLGRLLGMLFQWFHFTACLPDDQAGSALEKLKGECIKGWIMSVKNQRLDVFISCLLPHPIDCSKIGGHWEVWPDTAHQIKEGFKRLLCLVPYDIITDDVWDEIMPYWMECFRHEVPENELSELKILLSKVFDPELSPLGFETKQMYHFISSRFEDSTNTNQEQTLYWLQIITMLEIPIPIDFLFQMLKSGVRSLAIIRSNELLRLKVASASAPAKQGTQKGSHKERPERTGTLNDASSSSPTPSGGAPDSSNSSSPPSGASRSSSDNAIMAGDRHLHTEDKTQPKILTQRERQAQARAAFTAKLMQQATLLNSGHSIQQRSSESSISIPASPSVTSAATIAAPTTLSQAAFSLAATAGLLSTAHSQPLKSTTSSISDSQTADPPKKSDKSSKSHRHKGHKKQHEDSRPDKGTKERPAKLNLQISSADYISTPVNKVDNNLVCYILMLDIILKQLDLQEISSHRGLNQKEAQQAIELLNVMIATPWIGRHTCSDSFPDCTTDEAYRAANEQCQWADSQQEPSTSAQHDETRKALADSKSACDEQRRQIQQERDEMVSANIHAYGHCAQGFENEDAIETCVLCEIISTFHQLSLNLIEYFSPVIEVSICEVSQDAANGEFGGKPDYSRIGMDHLSGPMMDHDPGSSSMNDPAASTTSTSNLQKETNQFDFDNQPKNDIIRQHYELFHQFQQTPLTPFSPTYLGLSLKPEVLSALPSELQLTYNLLLHFHQYQTPDIVSQLLQMIKLISLHSQVLSKAAKGNPQFICWCQHNMLVGKLWSLCELESSEIARTCVPLLLHCITLPWGVRLFRDLVERHFNSDNWLQRFRAVERVVTIAHFCEPSTIKNSTLLQSTMASAFCYLIRCLDDIEAIVAQRALVSLEMMKTSSLKLLLWCLEIQFDYIMADRPVILNSVFQLYNHLGDRRFLTWEFFLNRFDTIFLEAQIYLQQTGEIPSFTMQDLKNTNTKSEIYQKKIVRAREALQEVHHSRSLSIRFTDRKSAHLQKSRAGGNEGDISGEQERCKQAIKLQRRHQSDIQHQQSSFLTDSDSSKRHLNFHVASPLRRVLQHGNSTSSRYQTIAYLTSQSLSNRKNSKFMVSLAMQSVPTSMMLPEKFNQHLPNSFVDDASKLNELSQENHVFSVVHRACDEDRDTNHLLTFLLMQYFSKSDPSHPTSLKNLNRVHQIVLRHLNILMGYSVARRCFMISAANLRLLPVFNAYLTSLPKVLDFNYQLGNVLLDTCLPILIYCPAPDDVPGMENNKMPNYSLWLLNPSMRQSWLMAVMTFLYKYQFGQVHLKEQVQMLMWIVINTLESNLNCRTLEMTLNRYLGSINRESSIGQDDDQHGAKNSTQETTAEVTREQSSNHHAESSTVSKSEVSDVKHDEATDPKTADSTDAGRPTPTTSSNVAIKQNVSIENPVQSKTLTKAETSDNLDAKSRSALKKNSETLPRSIQKSTKTVSASKVNTESDGSKSVAIFISGGDERLLPIGLDPQKKAKQGNFDAPQERLLPIGITGAQASRSESNFQAETSKSSTNIDFDSTNSCQSPTGHPSREMFTSTKALKHVHKEPGAYQDIDPSPQSSSSGGGKSGKRRFATSMSKIIPSTSHTGEQSQIGTKQHAILGFGAGKDLALDPYDDTPSISVRSASGGGKKAKGGKSGTKDYVARFSNQAVQPSFSSPSLLNEQLAQINRHSLVEEFSDKDLSMCLVILETFIHHEPSLAAQMLPNILKLVARYSSATNESWQSASNVHLVGGSMFVARQFIRVALHDLMDNNIFHQIFTSHFTGPDFYKSMATALADFPDLNQLTPLSKLFEDLNKQKNLPPASSLKTILENAATYFECIIAESTNHSQTTWVNLINHWENFLRKLILALPRYSETTISPLQPGTGQLKNDTATSIVHAGTAQALGQPSSGAAASQLFGSKSPAGPSEHVINPASGEISASCASIMMPIMRIILSTTKVSHLASCKTIVDPYSKIICYTVLNSPFKCEHLLEINHNCSRIYTRDREKYLIQRTIAYELIQVTKYRFFILEKNLLMLLLFILHDVGGTLPPKVLRDSLKLDQGSLSQAETYVTNISESLRQYIGDLLEFITDVHAISRINDNLIGSQPSSINRDSFGGHVKAAISQYLALEISSSGVNDNRTVLRHLPWLYTSPSLQQGQFIECVSHIRQLSWIILGSLQHSTSMKAQQGRSSIHITALSSQHSTQTSVSCQPIPIEKNSNVAEHVQVILAGFAEQSKESVLHMSGLFHAFLLCQLWTMYCENLCNMHPAMSEQYQFCQSTLDDFWAKITPGVLRLVGHSRVMSEMVSTHFLQLIESLIESNSSILIRYLPMWNSVFYSYKKRNKSRNLAIRLQKCIDWHPASLDEQDEDMNNKRLISWLEKVQYKMSHIEIQSSQATPFYLS